jgi:diketogulonate reductase-like aldo/keto reductase
MRKIDLGNTGEKINIIGQGTWGFDEEFSTSRYASLKESIEYGIQFGMNFIDTAERYGWGGAELTIGSLIKENPEIREDLFIATKVWGSNLSYNDLKQAANQSLKRLNIKTIDLYQIHWPNPFKRLSKTMRAMEELVNEGKIRYIGVSNFPPFYLNWAQNKLKSQEIVSNQIYFSLAECNPMKNQLTYAKKNNLTLIACSPLGGTKGKNLKELSPNLKQCITKIANERNLTYHQVALAWLSSLGNVLPIPKAASIEHKKQCAAVGDIQLSDSEINQIKQLL